MVRVGGSGSAGYTRSSRIAARCGTIVRRTLTAAAFSPLARVCGRIPTQRNSRDSPAEREKCKSSVVQGKTEDDRACETAGYSEGEDRVNYRELRMRSSDICWGSFRGLALDEAQAGFAESRNRWVCAYAEQSRDFNLATLFASFACCEISSLCAVFYSALRFRQLLPQPLKTNERHAVRRHFLTTFFEKKVVE
jgi:hypothetical protein